MKCKHIKACIVISTFASILIHESFSDNIFSLYPLKDTHYDANFDKQYWEYIQYGDTIVKVQQFFGIPKEKFGIDTSGNRLIYIYSFHAPPLVWPFSNAYLRYSIEFDLQSLKVIKKHKQWIQNP